MYRPGSEAIFHLPGGIFFPLLPSSPVPRRRLDSMAYPLLAHCWAGPLQTGDISSGKCRGPNLRKPIESVISKRFGTTGKDLFRPFDQRGANRSGLGLGLAYSRWAVEANRGRISVRTIPGTGCVFTVDLPRAGVPTVALA